MVMVRKMKQMEVVEQRCGKRAVSIAPRDPQVYVYLRRVECMEALSLCIIRKELQAVKKK